MRIDPRLRAADERADARRVVVAEVGEEERLRECTVREALEGGRLAEVHELRHERLIVGDAVGVPVLRVEDLVQRLDQVGERRRAQHERVALEIGLERRLVLEEADGANASRLALVEHRERDGAGEMLLDLLQVTTRQAVPREILPR